MLTCIIKSNSEPTVVELTYENMFKETKDIPDVEVIIKENWLDGLASIKTRYVCLLEADCLVNSAYFVTMLGLLKKNPHFRKIAMLSSATGVNDWANKFYGYSADTVLSEPTKDGIATKNKYIKPNKDAKAKVVYPVQIGFVPGSIIRTNMLVEALAKLNLGPSIEDDLKRLSTELSLTFWDTGVGNGGGNRVHLNPLVTYVTTDLTVNDLSPFNSKIDKLMPMFTGQSI